MLFVALGWDTPDSKEKRPLARAAHLAHWRAWDEAGRILLAGPMTDFAGSLFILEAETLDEVLAHIEADPYVREGVFQRTEAHPFKIVFASPHGLE